MTGQGLAAIAPNGAGITLRTDADGVHTWLPAHVEFGQIMADRTLRDHGWTRVSDWHNATPNPRSACDMQARVARVTS